MGMHVQGAAGSMGDEEPEEYDFEYSDDDEAEPDVEVRRSDGFGSWCGLGALLGCLPALDR